MRILVEQEDRSEACAGCRAAVWPAGIFLFRRLLRYVVPPLIAAGVAALRF
jgi:hypothetical protein